MTIVALLDPEASVPLQTGWALWFARARKVPLTVLLPGGESAARPLETVRAQAAAVVEQDEAFALVANDADDPAPDDAAGDGDEAPLACRLRGVDGADVKHVLDAVRGASPSLLLVPLLRFDSGDARAKEIGEEVLPRVSCDAVVLELGDGRWPVHHVMVAASRGQHPRRAIQLAHQLASDVDGGRLTGAYVEPDIGRDAESVGQHVIGRVLRSALGDDAAAVRRRVVVAASVEAGFEKAIEADEPDAVVLGMPRPGLLGARFFGLVPARLCKRTEVPVVILRPALPLGNRAQRAVEQLLQRFVPQLERDMRVELAARVQSSSAWNFDFVALISLSTLISALGLLQNSAAVIIGAMLVAPLMTPILGVGLALAQGNTMLARLAARSIVFGVGTAFLLAAVVGWVDGATHPPDGPTPEMIARGWPGLIDLFVAFVSGLAAAYANSRPGLVAALPGVAIAAALVPPIATSGLSFAAGDLRLAYGSFLLFVTNMVAIVLAAGLSLWMVGLRKQREGWLRHVGNGLIVAALALTVILTQRTHVGGVVPMTATVHRAVRDVVRPSGLQLISVEAKMAEQHLVLAVQVGGRMAPAEGMAERLRAVVTPLLDDPVEVRLAYVWQDTAKVPSEDGR